MGRPYLMPFERARLFSLRADLDAADDEWCGIVR